MNKYKRPERTLADVITPKMVRAGADALAEYDDRFETEEDAAIRIFQAMLLRRPESTHQSTPHRRSA
jgi:hypothetical protein